MLKMYFKNHFLNPKLYGKIKKINYEKQASL